MISPSKHSHPDKTVVSSSFRILHRLRQKRSIGFEELRAFNCQKENDVDSLFLPAMNLLYLLGLVEYRVQNDTFEYIGQ